MMDNVVGNVLLVGDGDFSFTVAYASKLKTRNDISIHTSTLLDQSELFKLHKNAEENVATLKALGVTVLYEVDATKLSTCANIQDQRYDFIIFNFPHTGGKSNIKKNRALLKDFFHSANETLHPDAQVIVTLCRGQGGTPRDRPVREWHDSWQVVAQAAYSGWVAHSIEPFSIERYPQYGSTGFRSLDRNFYTKDSYSHFFKRASAYYPETYGMQTVNGINLLNVVARRLSARDTTIVEHHPIRLVSRHLKTLLTETFELDESNFSINDLLLFDKPAIIHGFVSKSQDQLASENGEKQCLVKSVDCSNSDDVIQDQTIKRSRLQSDAEHGADSDVNSDFDTQARTDTENMQRLTQWNPRYKVHIEQSSGSGTDSSCAGVLPCTLVESNHVIQECVAMVTKGSDNVYAAQGQVFRRTTMDTANEPHGVANEMVVVWPVVKTELKVKSQEFRSSIESCLKRLLPDPSTVHLGVISGEDLPSFYKGQFCESQRVTYDYCSKTHFPTAACNQVQAQGKPDPMLGETLREKELSRVIGYVGALDKHSHVTTELAKRKEDDDITLMCALFDLDNIALARYDIPDHRLLWSENPAFLEQFKDLTPSDHIVAKTLSEHPPVWRHDLSFWEQRGVPVDEELLLDVIADIAGDAINRVLLVNVWDDPDCGLTSRCYRIVYQSLDRPLSHRCAHDIQNAIRLKVAEVLGVTLR